MKKYFRHFIILLVGAFSAGCSGVVVKEKNPEFVKVQGLQLIRNGSPYYFAGANMWYGCYLGANSEKGGRERLVRELDRLKSLNVLNLRILGASEETGILSTVKPAIQSAPGRYDENVLEGLDFLLSEMGKRQMTAVIYLNNFWGWTGGMSQYNAWFDGGPIIDPSVPGADWSAFMNYSAMFYRNKKANDCYREFIKSLIERENTVNGIVYKDDPAIMSWQLANEPRPGDDQSASKNAALFASWIDETSEFIHKHDPNHLVSTGSEGLIGTGFIDSVYIQAHSSKFVDYLTFHLWPKNWGWFDAKNAEMTYDTTEARALRYINHHLAIARILNKPITMEEFGLPRDSEAVAPKSPTVSRDRYYKKILSAVADSACGGSPIAGTNFWAWGGEVAPESPDGKWSMGGPLLGDPFQEPQGLNSVYSSDSLTLKIVSDHGEIMNKLGKNSQIFKTDTVNAPALKGTR